MGIVRASDDSCNNADQPRHLLCATFQTCWAGLPAFDNLATCGLRLDGDPRSQNRQDINPDRVAWLHLSMTRALGCPLLVETAADIAGKNTGLNDSAIRLALRSKLLDEHCRDADTVVIEELGLCRGQVRVDVAVVNGLLHGYEIKSDRDSLRRLRSQMELYGKVLDQATLVVGSRFLDEGIDIVPAWWGVLHGRPTSNGLDFREVRRPQRNAQRDPRLLVELLWSVQAMALLEERNLARGVRGKPRRMVWDRVCDHFAISEIAAAVRTELKTRAVNRVPA